MTFKRPVCANGLIGATLTSLLKNPLLKDERWASRQA